MVSSPFPCFQHQRLLHRFWVSDPLESPYFRRRLIQMTLRSSAARRWDGRRFQYRPPRSSRSAVCINVGYLSLQLTVCLIDLAGHERYLKTTLYGLTSGSPSCVILIVGGNAGLIGMSKEHLAIALALSVPVVVCITKVGQVCVQWHLDHQN